VTASDKPRNSQGSPPAAARRRILYLVTEDWSFWSHRLPVARGARDAGYEVIVAARERSHGDLIRSEGFKFVPISLQRGGRNPLRDTAAVIEIARLYGREKPDLVHHVALKPVLYGSLAAAIAGVPAVVNALTGLGYVFLSDDLAAAAMRVPVRLLLRSLLNRTGSKVLLQNGDDARMLSESGIAEPGRIVVIRGSGVDPRKFTPIAERPGTPVAVLASRMLWDKGIGELAEAARILKRRGSPVKILLIGDPDPENPASIPESQLRIWQEEGILEWRPHTRDMAAALAQCHIAVLPSYREGLPKGLLEAAAMGLPIVASDVPGCREIARDGENAILVPVRTAAPLADAIERLARDPELRRRLGRRGRQMVEESFTESAVVDQTLTLYRNLIAAFPRPGTGR
jgi:glycosyltransferase involved in cell wall biosynthesis